MVRGRATLESIVVSARQGFLLETCVVARSLLEQLAYAAYVWDKVSDEEVFEVKPQSLIKRLHVISAESGRAYGLLSQLSHYDPKIHYHFVGDALGETTVHRSWQFKIIASAWAFYLHWLYAKVFEGVYKEYPQFGPLENAPNIALLAFDAHFAEVDNFWVQEVRSLMTDLQPTRE